MTENTTEAPKAADTKTLVIVLVAIFATLIGGFLLKGQCLEPWDGRQFSHLCYNDIQPLYGPRGIEAGIFPYVSAAPTPNELGPGGMEYPVLTGLFMWFVGLFVSGDGNAYLIASAIALGPFGVYAAYGLARMVGLRALMWAAAPAIVFYAFHNWDLLVVAATVAGFVAWRSGRTTAAAVAFGIGGALKLYPLFFLAPLVLYVWHRAGWRTGIKDALRVVMDGVGTWLLINLPFMIVNFRGWWATYDFHRMRAPNYDSLWTVRFVLPDIETLNNVTFGLTALSFVLILLASVWKARRDGVYPFVQVAGALLAAFLLFNKVHSPQYTLWILPFFALLKVSAVWWLAYSAVDLIVYVGVFRLFYATSYLQGNGAAAFRAMSFGVQARAVLLAVLIVVFLLSKPAGTADEGLEEEEVVSHPPPNVSAVGEQAPA